MLCNACQRVLEKVQEQPIWTDTSPIQHHARPADLKSAIHSGCLICRRLPRWLTDEDKGGADRSFYVTTGWHWPDYDSRLLGDAINLDFKHRQDDDTPGRDIVSFLLTPVDYQNDRLKIPGYQPSNIVGHAYTLGLVQHWIRTCEKQHRACKRPQVKDYPNWRPTRLLYVGENDTQIRLVRGDTLADDLKYVTLSHCWGKLDKRLVLTKANIDDWGERLPLLGEWKTFSDAIDMTRQLGLSYIWIDSLCIIQDSISDWQRECPQMCNVYKRSYCNIAATSALDDTGGCFFARDMEVDLPLRIHFGPATDVVEPTSHIISADVTNECFSGTYDIHTDRNWFEDVNRSILNSRGWVLQERMMASRVLNFTNTQIYWECNELQASESHPYGYLLQAYAKFSVKSLSPFHLDTVAIEDRHARAFEIWGRAVQAYTIGSEYSMFGSVRNLTQPSDKLVAFSAIARELHPYLDCRYVAGHWERDLVRQLAWTGKVWSERSNAYRAPSWSWASVDTTIQDFIGLYSGYKGRGQTWNALVDIVDVNVELETDDPMGQVRSGSLRLRGMLLPVNVLKLSETYLSGIIDGDNSIILIDNSPTTLHFRRDDQRTTFVTPRQLFCLPISMTFSGSYTKVVDFKSILLEQVESQSSYCRVGYLGSDPLKTLLLDNFTTDPVVCAVLDNEEALGEHSILESLAPRLETITII
jgi:hypothetical protein